MAPEPKAKDIIKKGSMRFFLPNGDMYDGEFEANLRLRTISMHGRGVYTTSDGQVYEGTWLNDKLTNNNQHTVIYPDNNSYFGFLTNHQYSTGTYKYFDGSTLCGSFNKNIPKEVSFMDPNQQNWNSKVLGDIMHVSSPNIFIADIQNVDKEYLDEEYNNEDDDDDDDIENESTIAVTNFTKKKGIF